MQVAAASGQREQGAPRARRRTARTAARWSTASRREHDETLQHPRCVFQLLRKHFARYTPEIVEETCGIPREQFLEVCEALCDNSGRERTSAFCYAVGWTQHTVGVQYIRTAAIIQLLLGNIGRPGGGILALRGHASIQGSTDIPTLYNILPGYLPMPAAHAHASLDDYVEQNSPDTGYWANMGAYTVSLLKAWWGDAATAENDFCFDHLPRLTGDHSYYTSLAGMVDGTVKGLFVMGENPAVGAANGGYNRAALRKLDWLVVRDLARSRRPPSGTTRPRSRPASSRRRTSRPRSSSCPAAATSRRRAPSPTPSACCSGTSRPSSRRATAARSCGSCTTSGAACARSSPARRRRETAPCSS